MILSREQIDALLRGETVQRRVAVKEGEYLWSGIVFSLNMRVRFERAATYAVTMYHTPGLWISSDNHIAPSSLVAIDERGRQWVHDVRYKSGQDYYRAQGYTPLRVRLTAIRREGSEWVLTLERAETK